MTDYTLYLVTDTRLCGTYGVARTVAEAIVGGVTLVQVRDPHATDEDFLALARDVVEAAAGRVPVVLNDRVHLVPAAGADGAHIGQSDLPVAEARELLGPDRLLGLSITSAADLDRALPHGGLVDYAGLGPVWPQTTKPDAAPPLGPDGLAALVARCPWPSVAIGGVNQDTIAAVRAAGATGAAVVSAICGQPDPRRAAQRLRQEWT
ncbi:MAG: thiamine phosphate synthase [Propionibacteriaceae bacterium]|nr:thiamine phosphate synthase [Propionibacteriaceae bacterium]